MKSNKTHKLFALFSFIIIMVSGIILFININNIINSNNDVSFNYLNTYLYIILILISGLGLYISFIVMSNKISSYKQQTIYKIDDKNIETKDEVTSTQTKKDIFDFNVLSEKIISNSEMEKSNIEKYSEKILVNISKEFEIVQGLFYLINKKDKIFRVIGKYAYFSEEEPREFKEGVTLSGQVAKNKQILNISKIPDNYIVVSSGLGQSSPKHLLIIPIIYKDNTIGIIELASFKDFNSEIEDFFTKLAEMIGNNIHSFIK